MFFNVIAYNKHTKEWLVCRVDGRVPSVALTESVKNPDYLKLYDKLELEGEIFMYYKLKDRSSTLKGGGNQQV